MGAVAGSVMRVIPLEAAEHAHHMIEAEKGNAGTYTPKFFDVRSYKTLETLCETILPADADAGGAIEAGAPEFIDLLTSENTEYQSTLGDGLKWLDSTCNTRYSNAYVACSHSHEGSPAALLICESCGTVSELDAPEGFAVLAEGAKAQGFKPSHTVVEISGHCGHCSLGGSPASA